MGGCSLKVLGGRLLGLVASVKRVTHGVKDCCGSASHTILPSGGERFGLWERAGSFKELKQYFIVAKAFFQVGDEGVPDSRCQERRAGS